MDKGVHEKLLYYSQLISDNYKNLGKYKKEMQDFEKILEKEIKKYK
jgi:hypothetical protein